MTISRSRKNDFLFFISQEHASRHLPSDLHGDSIALQSLAQEWQGLIPWNEKWATSPDVYVHHPEEDVYLEELWALSEGKEKMALDNQ